MLKQAEVNLLPIVGTHSNTDIKTKFFLTFELGQNRVFQTSHK
jgi:hypothetical protein